jgi:hypothetical protein
MPVVTESMVIPLTRLPISMTRKPFNMKVRIGYSQEGNQAKKLMNTHQNADCAIANAIVMATSERREST